VEIGGKFFIFLLKGSRTLEFYRYDIAGQQWETMASAPAGLSGQEFRNGSCLTCDPDSGRIYVLKASYNEFFAYDVAANTWQTCAPLPMVGGTSGMRKKAKDGAALAYCGRTVYAFKGGNTQEFWFYRADSNYWLPGPEVPIGGGKRVKAGGALVHAPRGNCLYGTKGNNTFEFWQFPLDGGAPEPVGDGAVSAQGRFTSDRRDAGRLEIAPNPFSDRTRISYSLSQAGPVRLRLYDVTGKLVRTLVDGPRPDGFSSLGIPRSTLGRGVYVLKLETESSAATRKLVVE
jgi:hypothetical protein